MTEIERKALAFVNEVSDRYTDADTIYEVHTALDLRMALCRAIEQHEAFRQEVSDAIDSSILTPETEAHLSRFIIPKPDPLAEALDIVFEPRRGFSKEEAADAVRAALAKRGLEIREKGNG